MHRAGPKRENHRGREALYMRAAAGTLADAFLTWSCPATNIPAANTITNTALANWEPSLIATSPNRTNFNPVIRARIREEKLGSACFVPGIPPVLYFTTRRPDLDRNRLMAAMTSRRSSRNRSMIMVSSGFQRRPDAIIQRKPLGLLDSIENQILVGHNCATPSLHLRRREGMGFSCIREPAATAVRCLSRASERSRRCQYYCFGPFLPRSLLAALAIG
jgi:hypothetical protein